MLPSAMYSAYCKIWWRKDNGMGLLFRFWVRLLIFSEVYCYGYICGNGLEETLSCSIMTLPQKDMG